MTKEDAAFDAAVSAMGWNDRRMIDDARKYVSGHPFSSFGCGGECVLTAHQVTSFCYCLKGAEAALASQET